jgi:hypothetical protein
VAVFHRFYFMERLPPTLYRFFPVEHSFSPDHNRDELFKKKHPFYLLIPNSVRYLAVLGQQKACHASSLEGGSLRSRRK